MLRLPLFVPVSTPAGSAGPWSGIEMAQLVKVSIERE